MSIIRGSPEEFKKHVEEYPYYPHNWVEPYLLRQRKMGAALYGLLGIEKGDEEKMHAQHARNFELFGCSRRTQGEALLVTDIEHFSKEKCPEGICRWRGNALPRS